MFDRHNPQCTFDDDSQEKEVCDEAQRPSLKEGLTSPPEDRGMWFFPKYDDTMPCFFNDDHDDNVVESPLGPPFIVTHWNNLENDKHVVVSPFQFDSCIKKSCYYDPPY